MNERESRAARNLTRATLSLLPLGRPVQQGPRLRHSRSKRRQLRWLGWRRAIAHCPSEEASAPRQIAIRLPTTRRARGRHGTVGGWARSIAALPPRTAHPRRRAATVVDRTSYGEL